MFEAIDRLLFDEHKEPTNDQLEAFVPYMVTRYFSFYDKDYANYINETLNVYGDLFEGKEQFDYFDNIIPKLKRKKIQYAKRKKEKKEEEITQIPDFYSKKEIEHLTSIIK